MTKEPVGVVYSMQDGYIGQMIVKGIPHKTKLYTHAHQWQGLTDDEIKILDTCIDRDVPLDVGKMLFAKSIEHALKEKNNVS